MKINEQVLRALGFVDKERTTGSDGQPVHKMVWFGFLGSGSVLKVYLNYHGQEWVVYNIVVIGEDAKRLVEEYAPNGSIEEFLNLIDQALNTLDVGRI
jgi:hypothetical protein